MALSRERQARERAPAADVDAKRAQASADTSARWHRSRARGQRERFDRVQACVSGEGDYITISCGECGHVREERRRGCGAGLACVSCRGRISRRKRAQFASARNAALDGATRAGLLSPSRPGGRWSEKLVTLTAPHVTDQRDDADDGRVIRSRIERVLRAWRTFTLLLNKWLRMQDRGGALPLCDGRSARAVWYRSFEWTPASDRLGHPHIHAWFFGPYLPRELVRGWWARGLQSDRAWPHDGVGPDALDKLVIDVREVRGGADAGLEVIKYMTKDLDADGKRLAPELYAPVYEALDGTRVTQATRGFIALAERHEVFCEECGAAGHVNVHAKRQGAASEGADSGAVDTSQCARTASPMTRISRHSAKTDLKTAQDCPQIARDEHAMGA
jgi:hypothetical protein